MGIHRSALLWESWGLYGQSWVSTPMGVLGLYSQSWVSTSVGVLGAVWPVTGQHSSGSSGGCMGNHGSALLWESWGCVSSHRSALLGEFWGLYRQSRVSTPVGVLGEVTGQHGSKICLSPQNFCLDKHAFVATENVTTKMILVVPTKDRRYHQ